MKEESRLREGGEKLVKESWRKLGKTLFGFRTQYML